MKQIYIYILNRLNKYEDNWRLAEINDKALV